MSLLRHNDVILFQGDSVTDCGRNREDIRDMGPGYPGIISSILSAKYPDMNLRFINKGISGDRCVDLKNRWDEDCIRFNPSIVSILIGINDCWRRYDSNDETSVEEFEQHYMEIADRVKQKTQAKLVLMEPFVLPATQAMKEWRQDLDPKIQAVRNVAKKYQGIYVPLDGIFASAYIHKNVSYYAEDGVHPTSAGHGLIAKSWMDAVENQGV